MATLPRVSNDFLDTWMDYSQYLPAPKLFKCWGGLFAISAALSRRCWAVTDPTFPPLFPNLFLMLVGPPGCGKDIVINKISKLLNKTGEDMQQGQGFNLSGESISAKGILDMLADDESEFTVRANIEGKVQTQKFHSVTACIPELGTLLPVYDTLLVSILNDLYNCKPEFKEQIRGRGANSIVKIANPHLTMLVGTQPTTLSEVFPEQAFRMGFFSRTNIIHSKHEHRIPLHDRTRPNMESIFPTLVSDLRSIASMSGQFKSSIDFEKAINNFHISNPGKINHSRFDDYNTRRSLHLYKLSMICSASESNKRDLTITHYNRALEFLTESEAKAPSVFSDLTTSNGFAHSVEQVLEGVGTSSMITQQQLERSLRRTHKPHEVGQIITSMINGGDLIKMPTKTGLPKYRISKAIKEKLV